MKVDKNNINDDCPFKQRKHSSHCLVGDCYFYDSICPIYARFLKIVCRNNAASKTIFNPVTETYYEVRQTSTKYGKKGSITGLWRKS